MQIPLKFKGDYDPLSHHAQIPDTAGNKKSISSSDEMLFFEVGHAFTVPRTQRFIDS